MRLLWCEFLSDVGKPRPFNELAGSGKELKPALQALVISATQRCPFSYGEFGRHDSGHKEHENA